MGGLRFGFVDALVHSRLPPTLPARSSMAAATVMGADSYWVGDHLNALVPRSIATSEYLGIAAKFVPKIMPITNRGRCLETSPSGCPAVCDWACA